MHSSNLPISPAISLGLKERSQILEGITFIKFELKTSGLADTQDNLLLLSSAYARLPLTNNAKITKIAKNPIKYLFSFLIFIDHTINIFIIIILYIKFIISLYKYNVFNTTLIRCFQIC